MKEIGIIRFRRGSEGGYHLGKEAEPESGEASQDFQRLGLRRALARLVEWSATKVASEIPRGETLAIEAWPNPRG